MPRVQQAAASMLAVAALGAAAAALAPPARDPGVRALFDFLMVLRDGYGARHLPQPDEPRRNP